MVYWGQSTSQEPHCDLMVCKHRWHGSIPASRWEPILWQCCSDGGRPLLFKGQETLWDSPVELRHYMDIALNLAFVRWPTLDDVARWSKCAEPEAQPAYASAMDGKRKVWDWLRQQARVIWPLLCVPRPRQDSSEFLKRTLDAIEAEADRRQIYGGRKAALLATYATKTLRPCDNSTMWMPSKRPPQGLRSERKCRIATRISCFDVPARQTDQGKRRAKRLAVTTTWLRSWRQRFLIVHSCCWWTVA